MNDPKRFDIQRCVPYDITACYAYMEENENGDYVTYEDYAKLKDDYERLIEAIRFRNF